MKVNVKFDFLGNRNYIHSTSWLYKLLEILKENGYIKQNNEINKINAVFREKKDKQGYYLIDEEYKGADILFDINLDNRKIRVCYIEDGEKLSNSVPYDEDGLVSDAHIDKENKTSYIQVENIDNIYNLIVALNKKMLLELLNNEGFTSWSVGKFSINWNQLHDNPVNQQLKIVLVNNLGDMYCQSNIYMCDKLMGNIDFARKRSGK